MYKTTYLVRETNENGSYRLVQTTSREWKRIVDTNKGLPIDEKRHFIIDCIPEEGYIDRLVMETDYEEYRKWHKEYIASKRNNEEAKNYSFVSFDTPITGNDGQAMRLEDVIPDEQDVSREAECHILFDSLKEALRKWRPWAMDLLDFYLCGKTKCCTQYMMEKYQVSAQAVRKYKRQFETFVREFLSEK